MSSQSHQAMINKSLKEVSSLALEIRQSALAVNRLKKKAAQVKIASLPESQIAFTLEQIRKQISAHLEAIQEASMMLAEGDGLSWAEEADRMASEIIS